MTFWEYLNERAIRNDNVEVIVSKTQRRMTYLYFSLFSVALLALILLPKPMDDFTKTVLQSLLTILGTLIIAQNGFWFARQRTAGVPDPTAMITSTTLLPDGTRKVTTAPAAKPPKGTTDEKTAASTASASA